MKKLLFILLLTLASYNAFGSESKRVEVYQLSQHYWDVQQGDTLSGIVLQLLPGDLDRQHQLMQQILENNPAAFINGDINRVLAGARLWLPGHWQPAASTEPGNGNYNIERYRWGYIKRPK